MSLFHTMPDKIWASRAMVVGCDDLLISIKSPSDDCYLFAYLVTDEGISIHESEWEAKLFLDDRIDLPIENFERNKEKCLSLLSSIEEALANNPAVEENFGFLFSKKVDAFK